MAERSIFPIDKDAIELISQAASAPLSAEKLEVFNSKLVGLETAIGITFTEVGATQCRCSLEVAEHHMQLAGLVHGGIYAAIAESVGSLASIVRAGAEAQSRGVELTTIPAVVGVDNHTSFLRAVRSGTIDATATCVQAGKTTHVWEIEMRRGEELCAITRLRTMIV